MRYQLKLFQASPHCYCYCVVVVAGGDYGDGGVAAWNLLMKMLCFSNCNVFAVVGILFTLLLPLLLSLLLSFLTYSDQKPTRVHNFSHVA